MDFQQAIDRSGTASLKWDKYAGRDILPLWVADMDFASPPAVIEALQARVAHGVFGYTRPGLAQAEIVAAYIARHYGWTIDPNWLVWLPGLVPGLHLACRALTQPGEGVLVAPPIYPPFLSTPKLNQRELITVPLIEEAPGQWHWDFPAMEAAITPQSRMLFLCHPHNPVGRIWQTDELQELAEFAQRHQLYVVSDEIHCDLLLDVGAQHQPFAGLSADAAQRSITLLAPSKTFNLAGLTCALAIIPNATLRRQFQRECQGIMPEVNLMGLTAALAAYQDGDIWLQELLACLRQNRDTLLAALDGQYGIRITRPQATYLAWLDCRQTGISHPAAFFEAAGVGLNNGEDFGLPGFVRLNFGCPPALLAQALMRMQTALKEHPCC